jgi:hypothetical protein
MFEINLPDVVAEVTSAFANYERALVANDVGALDQLFWNTRAHSVMVSRKISTDMTLSPISARPAPPIDVTRRLMNTVITAYGRDFATANTEFQRVGSTLTGRQSHVWLRTPDGWRIAAAHVGLMPKQAGALVDVAGSLGCVAVFTGTPPGGDGGVHRSRSDFDR